MKKTLYIFIAVVALAALTLTGCIKETFPTNAAATAEQISESASALEASLNGIPSQMNQGYLIYGYQAYEYDMGFPSIMISLSEALGDFYPLGSESYDWYSFWGTCTAMGPSYGPPYVLWRTLYMFVKSANDIIGTVDLDDEDTSDEVRGYAGIAYACRAFYYYYLMTLYEPVENIYTDVSKVLGQTTPIITPDTASTESPRVSHDEMVEFILSDCEIAESILKTYTPSSRLFPGLAAVYAIEARTYMWDEQWANAATAARNAIEACGGSPMSETQWLDVNTGFNTATSGWIWYLHYDAENMGNLCNYIGWVSCENDWGYASLTLPGIDRSLYDHLNDTDFRKHAFLDPQKYDYYDYQTSQDKDFIESLPDYASIKFRCVGGDHANYTVGGIADVPILRVEEMYFIEAEAKARSSQNVSQGVSLLNDFMQSYRDPSYNFSCSSIDDLAKEILKQMQVEFWGEGTAFQTAKRIKPGVMKNYTGTNCPTDDMKINSEGIQPNWTAVITEDETQSNPGITDNNPDPSEKVVGPSPIDEYAAPGYVPGGSDDEEEDDD